MMAEVQIKLTGGPLGDSESTARPSSDYVIVPEWDSANQGMYQSIYRRESDDLYVWERFTIGGV